MRFANAMILVPFQPFRQIRQAIQAKETGSYDDTKTNDDVDGLALNSELNMSSRKERHLNATFLSTANMITSSLRKLISTTVASKQ